jgi:putative ABC transport system permease protein
VGALFQQKVRTFLTTLGVFLGTFVLVASVAIGLGVRVKVMSLFERNDQLRKIIVSPDYGKPEGDVPEEELRVEGTMDDAKRERIRNLLTRRWFMSHPRNPKTPLTSERLEKLAALDHVVDVAPEISFQGRCHFGDKLEDVTTWAAPAGNPQLRDRLVAGADFVGANERSAIVSEFLLFQWGIVNDADVPSVLGRKVRLEIGPGVNQRPNLLLSLFGVTVANPDRAQRKVLEKAVKQLPAALKNMDLSDDDRATLRKMLTPQSREAEHSDLVISEEFTITGVVRAFSKEDQEGGWFGRHYASLYADVILPLKTAEDLAARLPYVQEHGFDRAIVTVKREEDVEAVVDQIKEMGLEQFSLVEIAQRVKLNLLLISLAVAFVAIIALLVAAIGIINTMLMTVLERTHEIGVMKAVGARDAHIQRMGLVEGALIGLVGGLLGLLAGWLASFPLNAVARSIVEKQTHQPLEESLFAFPPLLMAAIVAGATIVATLAAVYPARRAAKVNPVTALRHE